MRLVSFGSDNHSGIHPLLLEEMVLANEGFSPSYEQDPWSNELKDLLKVMFKATDVAMVFNGTAANVLCLQVALESYHGVLCSDVAHLHMDECGAPEKIAGIKLYPLPSKQGKITASQIKEAIRRKGDQHHSQIKMVSITQPTEYGTLYTLEEIEEIARVCKDEELYFHMDGARLANAAVSLKRSLGELTKDVDLFSFGGAKNGLMLGEFVIIKNPHLKKGLRFFRKQSLQLPSKTRFLSAPFLRYLKDDLWVDIARHENAMAQLLSEELKGLKQIEITQPTQVNSVFCKLPKDIVKKVRKEYFFYVWDEKTFEVRLMTSFSTLPSHIEGLIKSIKLALESTRGDEP